MYNQYNKEFETLFYNKKRKSGGHLGEKKTDKFS
ncbi:hypothetical protein JOC26_000183 [Sporohalobacter salinus]|nr:hypothetical protein [Sporohalobacter salinus]